MADVKAGKIFLISKYITEEDLSGQVDGVATIFTLSNAFEDGTTRIFLNGLRQIRGTDVVETGPNQITFSIAPESGDTLFIDYIKK